MARPVVSYYRTRIVGTIAVDSLHVDVAGEVLTSTGLRVVSRRDITVDGVIRGVDGSGASISLTSTEGRVVVRGAVIGGSGRDHTQAATGAEARGQDGGNGGGVEIAAPSDLVAVVGGQVRAGRGGHGQGASSQEGAPARVAFSGAGGGGTVSISAGREIAVVAGRVLGADGGNGAHADASFATFDDLMEALQPAGLVDAVAPPPPPELLVPTGAAPDPPRTATADAGRGGDGGDVRPSLGRAGMRILISAGAAVAAGDGGRAATARGTFAEAAEARVHDGGRGGSVTIDPGPAGLASLGSAPRPGVGRPCGETPETRTATAGARRSAAARAGLGGPGGTCVVGGGQMAAGTGGGAGLARARTETCDRSEPGHPAQGALPGAGGHAICP